jgi:hypothetical protein
MSLVHLARSLLFFSTVVPHGRTLPFVRCLNYVKLRNHCSYVPPSIAEAIYGKVPGARLDPSLSQWVVPCETEIDMALQIEFVKQFPRTLL